MAKKEKKLGKINVDGKVLKEGFNFLFNELKLFY